MVAIQVAEANVPLAEVARPKFRADATPALPIQPDTEGRPSAIFDPDLTADDTPPVAARGIIVAASISAPIWALIAFIVYFLG